MIYYSKEPLKSWQPNLIMLDLEDDLGHIYVTRNTYDQAVLLSDKFNHDPELVQQKLTKHITQEDAVSYMLAVLPAPISILAPFYNLIDSTVKLSVDNIKQIIGVLSYMSMNLDFNTMLKVPYEVRANLVFTKSILLDYQGHFEDFNFRISSDVGHIVPGENTTLHHPRSDKTDFDVGEEEEDKEIVLEDFLRESGFYDIEIPRLAEPVEEKPATPTINATPASEPADDQSREVDAYAAIVNRFAD